MNFQESLESTRDTRESAEIRAREAESAVERLRQGGDFVVPTSREMQGSKTYWGKLKEGMRELFGPDHRVAKEAERIFDVFDNGGSARPETLLQFVNEVNEAQRERLAGDTIREAA